MEDELRTATSFIATVVMALALAVPVLAQEEEYVQINFELQTSGQFAGNTTFFALYGLPQSEFSALQLTDQDGDGVYTGNAKWMVGGKQLIVVLVKGTGTVDTVFGIFPGESVTTIREWREPMDITEDTTFSASITGTPSGMPSTGAGAMAGGLLPLLSAIGMACSLTICTWMLLRRR